MTRRSIARIVAGAPLMVLAFQTAPPVGPTAAADDCPNAEVVFARGTGEPVGPGGPGQAFYDSLTAQLPGKTINLYPVNYPSTTDYVNSAHAGADDEVAHVQATAAACPNTKIVIGGYSQGAGVADMTSHRLSPQVANHVAAVALFGNPQSSYSKSLSDSQIPALDPSFVPKAIDICLPNDNICAEGGSIIAHLGYVPDATNQAATFVAGRLQ
ncbi:cutinase family protein [Candidatus Mycobacterium wuenschmannii]|uniref:Cutinase n=1 Tax=Candidatus Mycobacterium wuenschmannii TaxID=3027808 RepID=A0ABY8VS77_9MYCO|nr:cutinase family protein [Candidatus Mycobacterium wuenschmannii]WIM86488.1 cutinase family protein [Candidatus Mycobacterium wuenschmannii]